VARQFGKLYFDKQRQAWRCYFRVEGKTYRLRSLRLPGGTKVSFTDEATAQAVLDDIRADIRAGSTPLQAISAYIDGPETKFLYHWRRFVESKQRQGEHGRQLAERRVKELTRYETRGHLAPLYDIPVACLTYGELEDWRDTMLASGLAPKTVKNYVTDVGTMLNWLERRRDIPKAPALPLVHVDEYVPQIPTADEQARILAEIPEERAGLFLARALMGLRPSEAIRANCADWHAERRELTVIGKGGLARVLPAPDLVADWIELHRADAFGLEPLFPNPAARNAEKRWTDWPAREELLRAMRRAGTPQFKPNEACRHAFATLHAGRQFLSEYLGHRDPKTTRRYARINAAHLRETIGK
jgi:integrase